MLLITIGFVHDFGNDDNSWISTVRELALPKAISISVALPMRGACVADLLSGFAICPNERLRQVFVSNDKVNPFIYQPCRALCAKACMFGTSGLPASALNSGIPRQVINLIFCSTLLTISSGNGA